MSRWVSVAYLTPVYAIVDIDAEPDAEGWYPDDAVARVQHGDSEVTRLDNRESIKRLATQPVLGVSYTTIYDESENVDPAALTDDERVKALAVAEHTVWPSWEGY